MKDLMELILKKAKLTVTGMSNLSSTSSDQSASQACLNLVRAYEVLLFIDQKSNETSPSETNHEYQVSEVVDDILHNGDPIVQKDCRDSYVFMHIVAQEDKKKGCPYYSIAYFDKKDGAYYQGFGSYNFKIVLAYKQAYFSDCNDNYALDRLEELSDKHWEECRQIALYDDELRQTVGALRRAIKLLSNAGVHNDDFAEIERLTNEMWDKIYKKHETTNNSESNNEE